MKCFSFKFYFRKQFLFILFLLFLLIFKIGDVLSASDQIGGDSVLEIFAGGKRYNSLADYQEEKINEHSKLQATPDEKMFVEGRDNYTETREMFDKVLRTAKQPGSLKFNPAQIKTIYFNQNSSTSQVPLKDSPNKIVMKGLSAQKQKQLNQVGFDTRIYQAIYNFSKESIPSRNEKSVGDQELGRVLQDSISASKGPLLLLSNQGKLRVMTLEASKEEGNLDSVNNISKK